ncbi:MAG: hypothetical protein B7Z33_14000 [Sphingomonadales bacterium 12-68-11]|nr:MAG: hypothetical protein B7Z33_14000 [Sphingomonadales bacterium 12-68-11]OYX17091.1 MAG: hypothetical protein B7Z07_00895 [Sphingomonadales bacterium 32-67-7]
MRAGARAAARWALALLYLIAAGFHFARRAPFIAIMPGFVPAPATVVWLTGLAEGLGALALLQPWAAALRKAGGIGLALYALCVWPANFSHAAIDLARPDGGLGLIYHVPRLLAQPLLIWLALWSSGATDRPRRS